MDALAFMNVVTIGLYIMLFCGAIACFCLFLRRKNCCCGRRNEERERSPVREPRVYVQPPDYRAEHRLELPPMYQPPRPDLLREEPLSPIRLPRLFVRPVYLNRPEGRFERPARQNNFCQRFKMCCTRAQPANEIIEMDRIGRRGEP